MEQNPKKYLRNRFRKNRRKLRSRFHKKLSRRILNHLRAILCRGPGSIPLKILFYWPIHSEVDLRLLPLWCPEHHFFLPRSSQNGAMEILSFTDGCRLTPDMNGIPSPDNPGDSLHPEELDLVLVPGTGFDLQGRRLGYGGGYYDRLLEGKTVPTLGIGFQIQVQKNPLPVNSTDIFLDALLTEVGLIKINDEFPFEES